MSTGPDEEFDAFMRGRWPVMVRLGYALTGDVGHAEDLAQAAFARAYASWGRVRRADDPDAYVRRIVINEHHGIGWKLGRLMPELLEVLELSGAIVTIDAMGCQKEIAAKIRQRGGDYVLAVKLNQPTLYEQVREAIDEGLEGCPTDRRALHGRDGAWSSGSPHLCGLPGPGGSRSGGLVAGPECGGCDVLGADGFPWANQPGGAVLHPEPAMISPGVRRGRAGPLGDRESPALATGCELPGGWISGSDGPRGSEPECHQTVRPGVTEAGGRVPTRDRDQAAQVRLE